MTVRGNVEWPLKVAGWPRPRRDQRIAEVLALLGIHDLSARYPSEISGGQQQRVAIARTLAPEPKVLLFDEPLSNLDAKLRVEMRAELLRLHRATGATSVYVTHDQVEAMTLADQVVVLRDGAIEQVGSPLALYDRPANRFVAQFIGTPQMNVVDRAELPPASGAVPDAAFVGIRPEDLHLTAAGQGQIAAQVELVEALGAETLIYLQTPRGAQIVLRQNARTTLAAGDSVGVDVELGHLHWFDVGGRLIAAH
jgi:multiple sugar transport system ATP-binding protein